MELFEALIQEDHMVFTKEQLLKEVDLVDGFELDDLRQRVDEVNDSLAYIRETIQIQLT